MIESSSGVIRYHNITPGEASYGLAEGASTWGSTGQVLLHETRNLRRIEAQAQAEGSEVKNSEVVIQYEYRNGRLIASSGEAKAIIVKGSDQSQENSNDSYTFSQFSNQSSNLEDNFSTIREESLLDQAEQQLQEALAIVEGRIQKLQTATETNENNQIEQNQEMKPNLRNQDGLEAKLDRKKEEIQQALAKIQMLKMVEVQNTILSSIYKNNNISAQISKIASGGGSSNNPKAGIQNPANEAQNYQTLENFTAIPDYAWLKATIPSGLALDILI